MCLCLQNEKKIRLAVIKICSVGMYRVGVFAITYTRKDYTAAAHRTRMFLLFFAFGVTILLGFSMILALLCFFVLVLLGLVLLGLGRLFSLSAGATSHGSAPRGVGGLAGRVCALLRIRPHASRLRSGAGRAAGRRHACAVGRDCKNERVLFASASPPSRPFC